MRHENLLLEMSDAYTVEFAKTEDGAIAMAAAIKKMAEKVPGEVVCQCDSAGMGNILPAKPVLDQLAKCLTSK